ncbi:MAG: tetratricopeptide repeat protein [Alphaproteobacteria bacterium]|nr:tetratricopeptide repeat protein [Alphaproteobacteria bacterium]
MDDPNALLKTAFGHHRDGRLAEATALYRRILEINPQQPLALRMLGVVLMDRSDGKAEAESLFLRHLALDPDNPLTLYSLGRLHQDKGNDKEAVPLFRRAAAGKPDLAPIFNDLAVSLHRLGQRDEALAAVEQSLAVDPGFGQAHDNRGLVLYDCGRYHEAALAHQAALAHTPSEAVDKRISILHHISKAASQAAELTTAEQACRALLELDAEHTGATETLADVLDLLHREDEGLVLCNRLTRLQGLVRKGEAERPEAIILLLGGVGAGHIPTRYMFDLARFTTLTLFMVSPDEPDAPLGGVAFEALTGADVVFNLMGEVEKHGGHFGPLKELAARLGKPLLNPPDRVVRTGRDQVEILFGSIPGLRIPKVRRMERDEPADFAAFDGPVLIRPGGAHGGKNLSLVATPSDVEAYLAKLPYDHFLLTEFCDFKGDRECYRKYRFIFVDRQPYPYHLAIGGNWLVHWWRAEMGRSEWKKQEEEAFLTDWRQVFGPRATAAVEDVARRLDLDYGGMDCSILPNGEVLFFEANACMLMHLDDAEAEFPYKHRAVPLIRDAVSRMVRDRCRSVPSN